MWTNGANMNTVSLGHRLNIASSSLTTALRIGVGVSANPAAEKPGELLELYEFEGCPFCRLVREVLTELDLDAIIYPCPKRGERFRPRVIELGGKAQFPFLVDPNNGQRMYESLDIIAYLYDTYAKRPLPLRWRFGPLQKLGSAASGMPRGLAGNWAKRSHAPVVPLELYSFESSPYARPVRDLLCELEIPYVLHSAGRTKASDWIPPVIRDAMNIHTDPELHNRRELLARAGHVSIPYLVDRNTDQEIGDSERIIEYLSETYATV